MSGEEYYKGYTRGGIYKLLSPCIRETSNGVAERVSLIVTRYLGLYSNFFNSSISGSALRNRSGISFVAL